MGLNELYLYRIFFLDPVKTQTLFSSHGGFLTIVSSQRNDLIKLTHYDERKDQCYKVYDSTRFHLYGVFMYYFPGQMDIDRNVRTCTVSNNMS